MGRAIVEPDGRIRLPDDLPDAARLQPGQELEVVFEAGEFRLYEVTDEAAEAVYSQEFLRELDDEIREAKASPGKIYASTEEWLQALEDRERDLG